MAVIAEQYIGHAEGDRGFADSPWSDDGEKAIKGKVRGEHPDDRATTKKSDDRSRQIVPVRRCDRFVRQDRRFLDDRDRCDKAIATAGGRGHILIARLAVS